MIDPVQVVDDKPTQHIHLSMGKIEDVHDAEYEGDPKGYECVKHAQYQAVDDDLLHSLYPVVLQSAQLREFYPVNPGAIR